MQTGLGTADIRKPLRQFTGQTDRYISPKGRNRLGFAQLLCHRPWLSGQQQAEGVDQLCAVLLQRRRSRFDLCHLGRLFGHFQVGGHTLFYLQPGQLQAAPGNLQVLLHHCQCLLGGTQLDIVLGGLHDHQ